MIGNNSLDTTVESRSVEQIKYKPRRPYRLHIGAQVAHQLAEARYYDFASRVVLARITGALPTMPSRRMSDEAFYGARNGTYN